MLFSPRQCHFDDYSFVYLDQKYNLRGKYANVQFISRLIFFQNLRR